MSDEQPISIGATIKRMLPLLDLQRNQILNGIPILSHLMSPFPEKPDLHEQVMVLLGNVS